MLVEGCRARSASLAEAPKIRIIVSCIFSPVLDPEGSILHQMGSILLLHALLASKNFLLQHFLYFAIYAALGWILEVFYRSIRQGRFVNAGFLRGPFLPIYGIGATCVLLLGTFLRGHGLVWEFLAYGVVLTAIEYAVGAACERAFGLRMWDYSEDPLNYDGLVCLPFSLVWAGLAVVFERWVHPHVERLVQGIPAGVLHALVPLLVLYFLLDFSASLKLLHVFVRQLSRIHLHRRRLSLLERGRLQDPFQRLLAAFPNLRRYLETVADLRNRIEDKRSELQSRFLRFVESRAPREEEFRRHVRDIATNREFLRTKRFRHHDSSVFRHALRVSSLSYRLGKFLDLDARAMARGGLLHDFFLYDWRNHDLPDLAREKFHGLEHPRIALENARRQFSLSPLEEDIIVKHMWPLTWRPPRRPESLLVSCVDKVVAVREFRAARRGRRA